MSIRWMCSQCKNDLEEDEIRACICKKCLSKILKNICPGPNPYHQVVGLIIEKSRCCKAPIKRTEGLIVEICTKCGKQNPPEPKYAH